MATVYVFYNVGRVHRSARQMQPAALPEYLPCGPMMGYCGGSECPLELVDRHPTDLALPGALEATFYHYNTEPHEGHRSMSVGDVVLWVPHDTGPVRHPYPMDRPVLTVDGLRTAPPAVFAVEHVGWRWLQLDAVLPKLLDAGDYGATLAAVA